MKMKIQLFSSSDFFFSNAGTFFLGRKDDNLRVKIQNSIWKFPPTFAVVMQLKIPSLVTFLSILFSQSYVAALPLPTLHPTPTPEASSVPTPSGKQIAADFAAKYKLVSPRSSCPSGTTDLTSEQCSKLNDLKLPHLFPRGNCQVEDLSEAVFRVCLKDVVSPAPTPEASSVPAPEAESVFMSRSCMRPSPVWVSLFGMTIFAVFAATQ